MILFTAEVEGHFGIGYDFLYLGVEGGRLVVKINNFGGLDSATESGTSNVFVNDTQLHSVQILFRSGSVDMLVDNIDGTMVEGQRDIYVLVHMSSFSQQSQKYLTIPH